MVFALCFAMCNDLHMASETNFYSTVEAAEKLHISRSTLTRWVQAGKVKPVVRGDGSNGAMFFRRSEIERVQRETRAAA